MKYNKAFIVAHFLYITHKNCFELRVDCANFDRRG